MVCNKIHRELLHSPFNYTYYGLTMLLGVFFWGGVLAFEFLSVLRVFSSPQQRPPTSKDFLSQIFNVECQTRELLIPFLLPLWYDSVLVVGLNPIPPSLEASTLPLGYRGGGTVISKIN